MKVKRSIPWILSATFAFGASTLLASSSEHMHHGKKVNMENSKRTKISGSEKAELLEIFKANEGLHAAFVDFDAKKVSEEAHKVAETIATLKNEKVKKMLTFSEGKLKEMTASKSRNDLSQNYHLISMALIHVLKNYDIGSEYNAYSCPMVKKKWVQNSSKMKKVYNPYAPDMAHCGSKDTEFDG